MAGTVPSCRTRAVQFLNEGNFASSIAALIDALNGQPEDVDLHLFLAYAYAKNGQINESVETLEHAADLSPTSAKVHYNLGVAYQRAHNVTQAKNEYLEALGLDATYIHAKEALDSIHDNVSTGLPHADICGTSEE